MSLPLLSRLWSYTRDAFSKLRTSLGPLDVLDRNDRRDLRQWIAALEAFARRIDLIDLTPCIVQPLHIE